MVEQVLPDIGQIRQRTVRLMGNRFEFTVVSPDATTAEAHLDAAVAEIQRIEALLTTFSDTSQTARINRNAGLAPVQVAPEVFQLIERACRLSALTQGAFDLTYGGLDTRLWNFDTSMTALPDPQTALASVRLINWQNIVLDPVRHTVFLREAGMRIGFGGIGKGYAADRAKAVLTARGVTAGAVNASGDLCAWGQRPDGNPWTVAVSDPKQPDRAIASFNITDRAVATSGNYEKFALIGHRRYSHTINPRTGLPVTGITSVTVIAPFAELADAMATPVMVMGVRAGLALIEQVHGLAALIITDDGEVFTTRNIKAT